MAGTKAFAEYERYKGATSLKQARELGACSRSLAFDLLRGHLKLQDHKPEDSPPALPIAHGSPALPVQRVSQACQTESAAEIESFDSDDAIGSLRSHLHTLVLTEKIVRPEHLAYKVLGTALGFLTKMTEGTAATLQRGRQAAVAAILVLAIAWESSCVRELSYHKSTTNPIKSLLLRWLNHHVPVVFRFGTSHHWCPSMSLRTRLTGRPLHRWFCRRCGRSSLGDTVGG